MITQIQGRLVEKNPTHVIIDCHGVGYQLNISLHTFSLLTNSENIRLFTHLQIKEDSHSLYGFFEKGEREIFRLLISVSGIGANIARTMLSSLSPMAIKEAIALGDAETIQSVKGIGAKTAQRTILDLKDKILKVVDIDALSLPLGNTHKNEALSALETLGFARKQAEKVCDKIIKQMPDASVENIIKEALKQL